MRLLPFVPVLLLASCAEQVTAPKPSTIVFEATQPNAPVPKRDQVAQAAGAPITAPALAVATAPAPAPVAAAPAPEKPKRNWLTGKVEEPKTATPAPTPAAVVTPAQVAAAPAPAPAAAPSGSSSFGGPRGSIRRVGPRSGVASQPAPQPPQEQAAQPAQPKKSWWTKKSAEPQPAPQAAPQQPQPAQPQVAQAASKKGQGPQPLANPPKVKRNWLTGKIEVQDSSSAAVAQAAPQPSVQQAPQVPQPTANPPKVKRHWLTGKIIEEPQQAVAQQAPAQKAPAPTLPQVKRQRPQEVVFQDQTPLPPVPRGGPRLPLPQQDTDGFRTTIDKQGIPKDEDLRSTAPRATSKPGSGDVIAKPPGQ